MQINWIPSGVLAQEMVKALGNILSQGAFWVISISLAQAELNALIPAYQFSSPPKEPSFYSNLSPDAIYFAKGSAWTGLFLSRQKAEKITRLMLPQIAKLTGNSGKIPSVLVQ